MSETAWKKARSVWTHTSKEIAALSERIDPKEFAFAAELLATCKGKIITSGTGTSGAAAKKVAHTLCCVERPALFLSPADAVHGGLGVVQPEDLVILISKGGKTRELAALVPSLETKGCKTLAVTENRDSLLAKRATAVLRVYVSGEPDPFNMLATSSTAAVIATFDALAIVTMERIGFTREQFGVIHPGGAVGERLLEGRE
ncbi:MAG: KpsF/GutQ family sugar-phosphate isomerase [Alkalispirochaetaceae bacterium]